MIKGNGVSAGIGIAPIIICQKKPIVIPQAAHDVAAELAAFSAAHKKISDETEALANKVRREIGEKEAAIFDAHGMIINDTELTEPMIAGINSGMNAAMAIETVMAPIIEMFADMDDTYMRERAADMADIKERLLRAVLGLESRDISALGGRCIIAAVDFTPSDTARMDVKNVAGLLTETGGSTSHTAIMARTLEIPAVVGIAGLLQCVREGETVAMDGSTGEVILSPDEQQIAQYNEKWERNKQEKLALEAMKGKKSITTDGRKVEVAANIGKPADVVRVTDNDGEGIGLFRSEFLYMDRNGLPDEEEQFAAYKAVLEGMQGKPVIVRTLDIGGDKELPALHLEKEQNPFLGHRAIRLCLSRQDLFKTQLRALMRASVYGNLLIMFPMICAIEELRAAKKLLHEVTEELKACSVPVDESVKVGIMVEIPAVAVQAEAFARECDFFSIGTNDLTQYTLAVDRGNDAVAALYSHYHPAVVHLIANTIKAAHKANIFCGMCGEAAGDPRFIPLLLGLGLDEFSVSPAAVLKTRKLLCSLDTRECKSLADEALTKATKGEILALLNAFLHNN